MEEEIWNRITNSAKGRFDYATFKEAFPTDKKNKELMADNALWEIIQGFAMSKSQKIMVLELFNKFAMTGIQWKQENIAEFLKDKESLFNKEIFATRITTQMLNSGTDSSVVYNSLSQLLQ